MAFFRQYIAPLIVTLLFIIALVAVSARIFLPGDMMAPAPIEEPISMGLSSVIPLEGFSLRRFALAKPSNGNAIAL